jgi:hypothetical protein
MLSVVEASLNPNQPQNDKGIFEPQRHEDTKIFTAEYAEKRKVLRVSYLA